MHYHSLGITVGRLDFDKILVQVNGKVKILKIGLSRSSRQSQGLISKSSLFLASLPKEIAYDMKMLAQVIIKLMWNKDFKIPEDADVPFAPE